MFWHNQGRIQCVPLINPTPDSIASEVTKFSKQDPFSIQIKSREIWDYTRSHYTREKFSETYNNFIINILKL